MVVLPVPHAGVARDTWVSGSGSVRGRRVGRRLIQASHRMRIHAPASVTIAA